MKPLTRLKRRRNALYVVIALAMGSPAAQADVFDDAWSCAVAVKDGVVDTAIIGGKALKFIATKPDCIGRLGSPATAAPIGVVVGLANVGVLPKSQPSCGSKLYETAAKPVAMALDATFGELGILPGEAKKMLVKIASDEASGALLAEIPGMDFVTGSLTCGCDLVDAGLSIDTIEKVLNTADNIGDKCGGPVWDTAKEIAGDVVNFAGDAAEEGVRQVSNLGDAIAGQTKHVPYLQYYDQNWAPKVEWYATNEFNNPNAWHGGKTWKQVWEPCVEYFDKHTQSEDTAQVTCDNMRSGGHLFPKKYFGHEMFQRVFEFEATVLANAEREKAYAEFAELKTGAILPASITENTECYAAASIKLHPVLPGMRKAAIDAVFGIPKKEKTHNGLAVLANSPPALWADGTFGAYVFTYFGEVDAGQFRADAGKAVQLALADFNAEEKIREKLADKVIKHYEANKCINIDTTDKDQQRVDNLIGMCPTQTCKENITEDYQSCRSDVQDWYEENAGLIADFDNSSGQKAIKEWGVRLEQCVTDAKKTAKENQYSLSDTPAKNDRLDVRDTATDIGKIIDARVPADDSKRRTVKAEPATSREPLREREPIQRIDERTPVTDSERRRNSREPLREREPIQRVDERAPATDSARRRTVTDEPRTSREPLREREPIQRVDERTPATDSARRRTVTDEPRVSREPLRQRDPVQRIDGRTPATEAAVDARRRTGAVAPATARDQRIGTVAESIPSTPVTTPITDADLPGCYVHARSTDSRVYACTNSTAYDNCLVVVKRDSSVTCRMSKD